MRLVDADNLENISNLAQAPTVDAKPVVYAYWIFEGNCGITKCSNCNWSIEECLNGYEFCPKCGAKMSLSHKDVQEKKIKLGIENIMRRMYYKNGSGSISDDMVNQVFKTPMIQNLCVKKEMPVEKYMVIGAFMELVDSGEKILDS